MVGAPVLSQGMPFPGAYIDPQTQVATPTTLSEHELLVLQPEEALKRLEFEARELEVERKTLTLQNSQLSAILIRQGLKL